VRLACFYPLINQLIWFYYQVIALNVGQDKAIKAMQFHAIPEILH
jgi:hypothetical protein